MKCSNCHKNVRFCHGCGKELELGDLIFHNYANGEHYCSEDCDFLEAEDLYAYY
jgi:hypothetical protein